MSTLNVSKEAHACTHNYSTSPSCASDSYSADLIVLSVITEALSACHYIPEVRTNVFNILYHALNSENAELQQASHECMKRVSVLCHKSLGCNGDNK